jgi:hypothetical protein
MKLTKPQLRLLTEILQRGSMHVADYYPPIIKLREYGLVEQGATGKYLVTRAGSQVVREAKR